MVRLFVSLLATLLLLAPGAPRWVQRGWMVPDGTSVFYYDTRQEALAVLWESRSSGLLWVSEWVEAGGNGPWPGWHTYQIPNPPTDYYGLSYRVFAAGRQVLIVMFLANPLNTWWEWDGTSWHQITGVPQSLVAKMAPLELVYDSVRRVVYVFDFGGRQVWQYDGQAWLAADDIPSEVPLPEWWVVYDPARRVVWLPNMWSWDGTEWRRHESNEGDVRGVAGMDEYKGRIILRRNSPYEPPYRDVCDTSTLEWNGERWTQTITTAGMCLHMQMAYYPGRGTVFSLQSQGEWSHKELLEYINDSVPTRTPTPTTTPTNTPTPTVTQTPTSSPTSTPTPTPTATPTVTPTATPTPSATPVRRYLPLLLHSHHNFTHVPP